MGFFFSAVKYDKNALSELMLINGVIFMIFGYARVNTNSQARDGNSLEAQIKLLKDAGAEKIFSDIFSGSKNHRPELDRLLKIIQLGDTLIARNI